MHIQKKIDYAEILILGKCICKCFYCLGNEMSKACKCNQLSEHFSEWKNFPEFIEQCKKEDIKKIYVSSVNTDPFIYKYIDELVAYLRTEFELVGIRGNAAALKPELYPVIQNCNEETSISLNAMSQNISVKIAGNAAKYEKYNLQYLLENEANLFKEREETRKIRVSIVINRYNVVEIPYILDWLSSFNAKYPVINYVQLRKVYKYVDASKFAEDRCAYDILKNYFKENVEFDSKFHESDIYKWYESDLKVSFWDDVFVPESIKSLNYFTSGVISNDNLLVPGFENK